MALQAIASIVAGHTIYDQGKMIARLRARVPTVSISFPDVMSHAARLRVIDHPIGVYPRQAFEIVGLTQMPTDPANWTC